MSNKIEIGIDIGGTFTDIFIKDLDSNTWIVNKVPSTPPNFSDGFMNGVHQTLELGSKETADIQRIIHGTTVATNTIITESGARVGMLLTEGVSDILQIGYGWRPKMYDLNMDPVEPLFLAPRRRCVGVDERMDFQGNVIRKLDIENLGAKAKFLVEKELLLALMGIETNFGKYLGKMDIVSSLATLSYDKRRSEFFTKELLILLL